MEDERCLPPEESPNGTPLTAGFEIVRSQFFSQSSEPVLSFGRLKMWVNSACLKKFPETDHVQVMVNSSSKTLTLYPSREDVRDALPWCSSGSGRRRRPRQLSCPIFFAMIYALMEWDPNCRYRLTGKYLCENGKELLAFDLRSAEAFLYGGDIKWRYTPHFPADWRDRFGTPAAEHSMEPLVHLFQEYAVFELETPSVKPDAPVILGMKGEDEIWPDPISENYRLSVEKDYYGTKHWLENPRDYRIILYQRCTWKRNGKTRIVWRCQNRLKNGPGFCPDSPTIEESDLHQALVAAINQMLHQKEFLLKPFEETDIFTRYKNLAEQQKHLDDAIVDLIADYSENQNWDGDTESFRNLIAARRKFPQNFSFDYQWIPDHMDTYNDIIVRHVLDKVTVLDGGHLLVTFRGGAVVEQVF